MFKPALFHRGFRKLSESSLKHFLEGDLLRDQLAVLRSELRTLAPVPGIDPGWSYEEFRRQRPVTAWDDWAPLVEEQRTTKRLSVCPKVQRFQPTSGSTFQRKWIPYNRAFLKELNRALKVWMSDVYDSHPGVMQGSHYWSLSGLPQELRREMDNDDLKFLNPALQLLLRPVMAVPSSVQNADTVQDSTLLTLGHLVNRRDLTFISVWSPTFLLSLLGELDRRREELASSPAVAKEASKMLSQGLELSSLVKKLWPKLALISAWDSAESSPWAKELRSL